MTFGGKDRDRSGLAGLGFMSSVIASLIDTTNALARRRGRAGLELQRAPARSFQAVSADFADPELGFSPPSEMELGYFT
jgi:hypothetical protein